MHPTVVCGVDHARAAARLARGLADRLGLDGPPGPQLDRLAAATDATMVAVGACDQRPLTGALAGAPTLHLMRYSSRPSSSARARSGSPERVSERPASSRAWRPDPSNGRNVMAHLRDPRTSIQSRLAAEHHPVPSQRTNEDPSSTQDARASDEPEQMPGPRPTGVSGTETVAFVLALVIVVVLVALL
jgi:hypothetical protein